MIMPRNHSSIEKIRAELGWVNEPEDPNVCGCDARLYDCAVNPHGQHLKIQHAALTARRFNLPTALERSIIASPNRKARHAQAYCSRVRRHRSSAAVAGYGAKKRTVVLSIIAFLIGNQITYHIKTKNHFDASAEVVCTEEIDGRPTEQ
jgi:hypothetical protein